ncbi:MAG: ClC family H(+)/Cl(-) exchange transporter [Coriobacteriales bacterium]|nr:ClC family H(+)/Cl(-) exchange transporter [Coriobacteriales bacterium]
MKRRAERARVNETRVKPPMEFRLTRSHRVRLVGEGTLVGLAVGLIIAAYRFFLHHAEELLRYVVAFLQLHGVAVLLWFLVLGVLMLVVGKLMLLEPYTQGSGIPQTDAEVAGRIDMPWMRVLPIKFVEGVLCAFAGLSLGREGPSVQLGAVAGKGVSRALRNDRSHERLLVTCGAAAGMSAAFHAPLTGVLFALEEIHREFNAPLVISVMASSVVADYVSSQILGTSPVIHFVVFSEIPHELYLSVLLMGIYCGMAGWAHNKLMFGVQDRLFGPLERFSPYVRLAIPFALAGIVALLWPDLLCGGDAIVEHVKQAGSEPVSLLFFLLIGKMLFTSICFGSGAPGGTLFPLVVMGALLGALYGAGVTPVANISGLYENSFIVLGIAGLFSAVIQAPVTAVVLVFELTGSLDALLATTVVSVLSYVCASLLKTEPYYEHLYARMMGDATGEDAEKQLPTHDTKVLHAYTVGVGSAIDGHAVREIAWPEGSLVVTVTRAGLELVPNGDSRLEAFDEICVVMGGKSEIDDDAALKALCAAND